MNECPLCECCQKTIPCLLREAWSCGHRDVFNPALEMKSINIRSQANRMCSENQSGHWFNSLPSLSWHCQTWHLKCFIDGAGGSKGSNETETGVCYSSVRWILNRSQAGHWRNLWICWICSSRHTSSCWGCDLAPSLGTLSKADYDQSKHGSDDKACSVLGVVLRKRMEKSGLADYHRQL